MSSYMANEKTIDRIINGVVPNLSGEDATKLGRKLLAMNAKAVIQRYGTDKGTEEMIGDSGKSYKFRCVPVNIYQALKSIQCFSYQCSEGTVPRMKLYKWLDEMERLLSNKIIDELPEYKNAEWG